jgi:hypothetical protein
MTDPLSYWNDDAAPSLSSANLHEWGEAILDTAEDTVDGKLDATFQGSDGEWQILHVADDGTSSSTWDNRWEIWYTPSGGSAQRVAWFNEYGELRLIPAKDNTVALRVHAAEDATDLAARDMSQEVLEVADVWSGARTTMFGVYGDGTSYHLGLAAFVAGIGVGNSLAAASLGSVVKKIEIFDEDGNSLGYLPVYDAIT